MDVLWIYDPVRDHDIADQFGEPDHVLDLLILPGHYQFFKWRFCQRHGKKHPMKTEHYMFLKDIKKGLKSYSLENKSTVTALENYLKEYGYSDN